jgi:hypothetical protein
MIQGCKCDEKLKKVLLSFPSVFVDGRGGEEVGHHAVKPFNQLPDCENRIRASFKLDAGRVTAT